MASRFWRALAFMACASAAMGDEEPLRTWTDLDGRGVRARYVSHDEQGLVLELEDGRRAVVGLERLSEVTRAELEQRERAPAKAEPAGNWSGSLKDDVALPGRPGIEEVKEGLGAQEFVYVSEHYRFVTDVPLTTQLVGDMAELFEATYLLCHRVPLGFEKRTDGELLEVRLFETEEAYHQAGAGKGTTAMFLRDPERVLAPFSSLGVRKAASRYSVDRDKSNAALIHVLIHQLMPKGYSHRGASADWVTQALAYYLAAAPYRSGRFRVKAAGEELREMVVGYGSEGRWGWGLGDTLVFPPLERLLAMPYHEVLKREASPNDVAAAMVLAYFAEMDGEGDAKRLKAYLQRLKVARWDAGPGRLQQPLLDGRSPDEVQEEISRAWKKLGVEVRWREF